MEERPCNQGYVLGINARRAAELFYTRLLPETRATFVGSSPAGSQARFSEQDLPAPLPHASALLHHKRKHWTSPFRLLGSPGFKCHERLEFRDLSATKQLSSPYSGI